MRAVIVHGTYGDPGENWFPWLADEVRAKGHDAVIPRMPTPDGQTLDGWLRAFEEQVGPVREDDWLVGHSLGVGFVLRVLEKNGPVGAAALVSGFIGELGLADFDPLNAPFFETPFDWQTIKENVTGPLRVYNGDDDPYVPSQKGRELAQELGVDVTVVPSGGHINAEAGYTRFQQLLDDFQTELHSEA